MRYLIYFETAYLVHGFLRDRHVVEIMFIRNVEESPWSLVMNFSFRYSKPKGDIELVLH